VKPWYKYTLCSPQFVAKCRKWR